MVWASWLTGATLGVEVGVGTSMTFGMAVGIETGTAGDGSGVTGATDCGVHWMGVAGCGTGLENLLWACSDMADGAFGSASLHLTLHS